MNQESQVTGNEAIVRILYQEGNLDSYKPNTFSVIIRQWESVSWSRLHNDRVLSVAYTLNEIEERVVGLKLTRYIFEQNAFLLPYDTTEGNAIRLAVAAYDYIQKHLSAAAEFDQAMFDELMNRRRS